MDLIDKKNQRPEKKLLFRWDYKPHLLIFLVLILLLFLLLKSTIVDAVVVRGNSMFPVLQDGNITLVNKLAYGLRNPFSNRYLIQWSPPTPGDVVIFYSDGKQYIKEVIGVPGMPLVFHGGFVEIGSGTFTLDAEVEKLMRNWQSIPDEMVFVVGHNKKFSLDSRSFGPVMIENISGKMLFFRL